jgi:sucrose-6-phosphate hydrolase SacC (GH32 family)
MSPALGLVVLALTAAVVGAAPSGGAELYNELYRPQFHFSPQKNWTNDPNGMVYYKGEYHLFFQHNPFGIDWGNMTWGHAVSPDLVHWKQLPNALEPDRLGTMFSGSAVVDWDNTSGFQTGKEKTLVAIYTAAGDTSPESKGQPFTQCIAYSSDRGRTWTKYDKNPVLGHILGGNRDPKVIWHAPSRCWVMALFLDGNEFALFSSPDLKAWKQLQRITMKDCGECPDFFPLHVEGEPGNTKWVLTAANGHYLVGDFDGEHFTWQGDPIVADHGANYYAVQTYSDIPASDGRRIQISWMNGGKYPGMPFNQQMSFPCDLKLRQTSEGLRIFRTPVKELKKLRGAPFEWKDRTMKPGEDVLTGTQGDTFEILATFEPGDAEKVTFSLRGTPVTYQVKDAKLTALGREAELKPEKGRVTLQILLDRSSIEVFGNGGRVSMTSCFLPPKADRSLHLTVEGGSAKLVSLQVYPLKSAWK